jgi:hypothetical protein
VNIRGYLSLLISFALTLAPAVGAAAAQGWTQVAAVGLAVAIVATFNVWVSPNLPASPYVKPSVAFALAALLAVQQVIGSGGFEALTVAQWIMIGSAAFAAIGITAFPNAPQAIATRAPAP